MCAAVTCKTYYNLESNCTNTSIFQIFGRKKASVMMTHRQMLIFITLK